MAKDKIVRAGVSMAREIAEDAAGAIAKKADDWGWKGGKPGEITGTDFMKRRNKIQKDVENYYQKKWGLSPDDLKKDEYSEAFEDDVYGTETELFDEMVARIRDEKPEFTDFLSNTYGIDAWQGNAFTNREGIEHLMRDFYKMEQAGVPRRWTGKLLTAGRQYAEQTGANVGRRNPSDLVSEVYSKAPTLMEDMTESQRQVFMQLLPTWQGSLDVLVDTVRIVGG